MTRIPWSDIDESIIARCKRPQTTYGLWGYNMTTEPNVPTTRSQTLYECIYCGRLRKDPTDSCPGCGAHQCRSY